MHRVPREVSEFECPDCHEDMVAVNVALPSIDDQVLTVRVAVHLDEFDREGAEALCDRVVTNGIEDILEEVTEDND
jgi:hypothetical protein